MSSRTTAAVWLALLVITMLVVIAVRVRLLDMPLERDEGEYAYAGQLMRQGVPPYQLAYNMKFPGTYAAYAVLMSVFGESARGIRLGLLVVNLATIALIFLLGLRLLSLAGASSAAAGYAVLSVSPSMQGFAGHATHFVVLPVLAAIYLLVSRDRPSIGRIVGSGLLLGLALLMKQPGAVFLLPGLLCLRPFSLLRASILAAAAVLPFAVTCLLLWNAGVFDKFWFWTVQYAREYGTQTSFTEGAKHLRDALRYVIRAEALLWLLAAAGGVLCLVRRQWVILALFGLGVIGTAAGFYFRPHYFILLLPGLALMAGASAKHPVTMVAFAAALALPIVSHREFFFRLTPEAASRHIYGQNPFPESVRVAAFLREKTTPEETIAVVGSEPQIYFYSGRKSATGYIYTYGLMEPHQYALQMQEEMIREIETAAPRFLVFVSVASSWSRRQDSHSHIYEWINDYSARRLRPAGYVGILEDGTTEYRLPYDGGPLTPTGNHLTIWERRD